ERLGRKKIRLIGLYEEGRMRILLLDLIAKPFDILAKFVRRHIMRQFIPELLLGCGRLQLLFSTGIDLRLSQGIEAPSNKVRTPCSYFRGRPLPKIARRSAVAQRRRAFFPSSQPGLAFLSLRYGMPIEATGK